MSNIEEKKPIYKKWWFWGIIIIALLVLIGGINGQQQVQTTLSSDEINQSKPNVNNTEQEKKYSVGEIYQDNSMAIKYVSLDENFTGYNQYADIKEGCKIVKAEFEAENLGTSDLYFSAYNFKCYADGYDCESFWFADNSGFSSNLSNKKKAKGTVYFQVPIESQSVTIEYDLNIFTNGKVEFIVK